MSFTEQDHDLMARLYDNHKLDNSSKDVYYDYVKMVNEFLTIHNFKQNIKLYDDSDKPLPVLNVIQDEMIPYKFPWDERTFDAFITKPYKVINISYEEVLGNSMTHYLYSSQYNMEQHIQNDLHEKIYPLPQDVINKEFVAFVRHKDESSKLKLFVKLRYYQPV